MSTRVAISAMLLPFVFVTDDAGTVKKDGYELEVGYDTCKDESELINKTCGVSFKHGVTDRMDIGFAIPYRVDPALPENAGAVVFDAKFSLIKELLAISLSNELGEKEYFVNAICTKCISVVRCSINAGYLSSGDETVRGIGSYGAAFEVPLQEFDIVGEVQGQEGGGGNGLVGVRYHLFDNFFTAAGISKDFQTDADKVTAGFHLEF